MTDVIRDVVRDVLAATQAHLRVELTGLRDSDIFIASHEDQIPPSAQFPLVGIKDGAVEYQDIEQTGVRANLTLALTVKSLILDNAEAALMGTLRAEGLFQICQRVRDAVHWARLPVEGLIECLVVAESPSYLLRRSGEDIPRINAKTIRAKIAVWRD